MKYPIRVLLSLLTLCTISLGTNNVSAESNQCREIRAVRRLAIRENLDRDNLATLEYKYCGQSNRRSSSIQSPRNSSQDCFDLTAMAKLASMTQEGRSFLGTIESLQQVICNGPSQGQRSSLEWPNGETAKSGSKWKYPNGTTAKFGSKWKYTNGTTAKVGSQLKYPNGKTAKFGSSGSWKYPNGQTAQLGSRWYSPKGKTTSVDSLLSQGCSIVGTTECDRILTHINRSDRNSYNRNRYDQNRYETETRDNFLRDLSIMQILDRLTRVAD
ncbi:MULTISPECIES: hypothetical protein [unclassified Moorena]|uniref:hypothetical protein n=1 Tax=unclassified Moorena TaxID=2683338 RepID=UPI0013C5CB70|nr:MULTISPECIES: hypothetical protein [unclassified Moorena]NEO18407.1 hypothetical protein [Moorena sp. SIO4A5]NEQ57445.1 hypothetical protein [Moorena sp. SIO4A1]